MRTSDNQQLFEATVGNVRVSAYPTYPYHGETIIRIGQEICLPPGEALALAAVIKAAAKAAAEIRRTTRSLPEVNENPAKE